MNVFQFFIICKRTNNANNATHYVKLGKKRRLSSKHNYYIISPKVIIKAIIIGGASNVVKVNSSGEDPRATGGLVSNLSHPQVNKTKQHF